MKADQSRLDQNQLADLGGCGTEKTQQPKLAAPVNDDRHQRARDPHDRNKDGHRFEGVSDGEGLVEDADRLPADIPIGKNEYVTVRGCSHDFVASGFEVCVRCEVDR
jgi:hypothetical protein